MRRAAIASVIVTATGSASGMADTASATPNRNISNHDWIAREDPDGRVVPSMLPAFTDSRTWRDAFPECVAYGFFPMRHTSLYESWPLVHAPDERIDVRDLGFAAAFFRDVAVDLLG